MRAYKLYLEKFNYLETRPAENPTTARSLLLKDLGLPVSEGTLNELKEVSISDEPDSNLFVCPNCGTAVCRSEICPPRKSNFRAYHHWVLRTGPPFALIPCLYRINCIKSVKVSLADYNLFYKFDWRINVRGKPTTIVEVGGKNEAVSMKTVKQAVATLTEEYEKFGETIYLGDWSTMDFRDKMDLAMLSIHGQNLENKKLNFPENRKQYLEYLETNPAFLEKIKTAAYIKRRRVKRRGYWIS